MKKIILFMLLLAVSFLMISCQGEENSETKETKTEEVTEAETSEETTEAETSEETTEAETSEETTEAETSEETTAKETSEETTEAETSEETTAKETSEETTAKETSEETTAKETSEETTEKETEEEDKINPAELAQAVISSFGVISNPWDFLPPSMALEAKATTVEQLSYENFTQVKNIPQGGMGKSLNVVYDVLNTAESGLQYVRNVYAVLDVIQSLYQTFLSDNPEDIKTFSGEAGGFGFTIELLDEQYKITAYFKELAKVELYSDRTTKETCAKIELVGGNKIKYTATANSFKIALMVLNAQTTQIEFIREKDTVTGYVYENLQLGDLSLQSASAFLKVDALYTTIVGNKGDFVPSSDGLNCEVYDNATGKLVGAEVREMLAGGTTRADTMWFPLASVEGIDTIKKTDETNGINAYTIYLNGHSEPIKTKKYGGFSLLSPTRRFDIEFKEMYFYTYNAEEEKYEKTVMEIPMMFVQEKKLPDFAEDYKEVNNIDASISLSLLELEAIKEGYYTMVAIYDDIAPLITVESIMAYLEE